MAIEYWHLSPSSVLSFVLSPPRCFFYNKHQHIQYREKNNYPVQKNLFQVLHLHPGTALNTEIFFKVWDQVFLEKRYLFHEFVVKVDPDTVFLVDRLRVAISFHNDEEGGIYFNNCKYGLHGPIEVFSQKAVDVWKGGRQRCVDHFEKLCSGPCLWGEDMFIDQCLQKVLKVKRVNDWNLISEAHCDSPDWPECRNGRVTFHPFKDLVSYEKCLENADAKSWTAGGQLVL